MRAAMGNCSQWVNLLFDLMLKFLCRAFKRLKNRLLYYFRYVHWLGCRRALCFLRANRVTGRVISMRIPAIDATLNFRAGTSDISVLEDTFLRDHYGFNLANEPEVIVDAGAHIGFVSVLFANRYPNCRIIAIEPEADNFRLLCTNTEAYDNITAVNAALWFESATLEILNPKDENWAYRFSALSTGDIQAVSMDQLINEFNLTRIDLLKIDIEGAEKEVMENARGWIDAVDAVVIELHDRFRTGCSSAFYEAAQRFPCEARSGPNIVVSMNELKVNA